jgi:hypothetical protein
LLQNNQEKGREGQAHWHANAINRSILLNWTLKQRKVHTDSKEEVPSASTSLSYTFVHSEYSSRQSYTLHHLLKMEPTQSSETSAFNTQTPGKYPEDNLSKLQHFNKTSQYNLVSFPH